MIPSFPPPIFLSPTYLSSLAYLSQRPKVYSHASLPLVVLVVDPNLFAIEVEVNFKLVLVDCYNCTLEPLRTFAP